jgi:hypothetical protein
MSGRVDLFSLLSGAIVMAFAVAGTFFARFYLRSRERLFLAFAVSFWLQALQRLLLATLTRGSENEVYAYLVRFLAYLVLLIAIVDRNRRAARLQD